jgi:hypothetical protein
MTMTEGPQGDAVRRSHFALSGVVLVLALSLLAVWRLEHRGPSRPSVGDAIGRFRTSSTVATSTRSFEPRPGVYVYSGTGDESLSFLDTRQSQGPIEPGTVMLQPKGCWQFRIDYNSFHHQAWERCSSHAQLVESGGTADQRFDFVAFKRSEHSVTRCVPPFVVADLAAPVGASTPVHCRGHSGTTNATFDQVGTATYAGRDTVIVGGVAVPALHTREDLHLSGGQSGSVHIGIWFAAGSGLPLKETHSINVESPAPAPINHVTYSENGSWQLTSMTPRV